MASGTLTNWNKNVEWDQVVSARGASIVYRNNTGLLSRFPIIDQNGGSAHEWRVNTTGNTSVEVYSEGGAQPTPVAQNYVMATLASVFYRAMIRMTGHVRTAIRGDAVPEGFNVILNEFDLGAEDLADLIETTNQGTGNNGIQLAVDSAGTYANIN